MNNTLNETQSFFLDIMDQITMMNDVEDGTWTQSAFWARTAQQLVVDNFGGVVGLLARIKDREEMRQLYGHNWDEEILEMDTKITHDLETQLDNLIVMAQAVYDQGDHSEYAIESQKTVDYVFNRTNSEINWELPSNQAYLNEARELGMSVAVAKATREAQFEENDPAKNINKDDLLRVARRVFDRDASVPMPDYGDSEPMSLFEISTFARSILWVLQGSPTVTNEGLKQYRPHCLIGMKQKQALSGPKFRRVDNKTAFFLLKSIADGIEKVENKIVAARQQFVDDQKNAEVDHPID